MMTASEHATSPQRVRRFGLLSAASVAAGGMIALVGWLSCYHQDDIYRVWAGIALPMLGLAAVAAALLARPRATDLGFVVVSILSAGLTYSWLVGTTAATRCPGHGGTAFPGSQMVDAIALVLRSSL